MTQDFRGGFHTVEAGQAYVHQYHVGPVLLYKLHSVSTRFGFPHHAKVIRAAEDRLNTVAHDLVIIHEEDVVGHIG